MTIGKGTEGLGDSITERTGQEGREIDSRLPSAGRTQTSRGCFQKWRLFSNESLSHSPEDPAASCGHMSPNGDCGFCLPGTCPWAAAKLMGVVPRDPSHGSWQEGSLLWCPGCRRQRAPEGSSQRDRDRGQAPGEGTGSRPQAQSSPQAEGRGLSLFCSGTVPDAQVSTHETSVG